MKWLSRVRLFATTPWTVAHQAPPSMEFSRWEYWSGLPFPSPGDLPNPGIKPQSPTLQADALPSEPPGNPLESESHSVLLVSLWPSGLHSPWNSPGQNADVDSHSLLQGIFPTQGSNPGLQHCRLILYQLSHQGHHRREGWKNSGHLLISSYELEIYLLWKSHSI